MILHPAQYLGVADILTKRQNILSTVEKWQTESDTICCVEELLFWRRATHKKKTCTGAFKHMANSPLHCRSAVNLSQVLCWQAPQSTAYSSGTITTDVSRGQKDISEYIAYNNATELWLHIGTIKPGYRMHCWRWISTKTAGFGFLSYIWVKKVFWEQSTSEKANNTCWANRIICITPDQALVYFILLQSSMVHKKLPPLANTQLERNAGKHSWHNRHYSHLLVLTVEKDISEGKKCKSSFQV